MSRQSKNDDRRAAEHMAEGNFHDALARYDAKGGIKWTRTQEEARAALVRKWAADTQADPSKTRFVFAYTNDDVDKINSAIRKVRRERGDLGEDHTFTAGRGQENYAAGDRVQIIGTDKKRGLLNGNAGTISKIEDTTIHLQLDGRGGRAIAFDAKEFNEFRHGYAGTIYKGQGRTLDQTYARAIADYSEAIRRDPKDRLSFYNRAVADYGAALRLDPANARAFGNRGLAHYARRNYDRAIADFTEAIRLDPRMGYAYRGRGNAYDAKGEIDRADADFAAAKGLAN